MLLAAATPAHRFIYVDGIQLTEQAAMGWDSLCGSASHCCQYWQSVAIRIRMPSAGDLQSEQREMRCVIELTGPSRSRKKLFESES